MMVDKNLHSKWILLLVSRPRLSPLQSKALRMALDNFEDWNTLLDLAQRKFASSFLYHHIENLSIDTVPPAVLDDLRRLDSQSKIVSMGTCHSLIDFHEKVIAPLGVPHCYFKGPVLAEVYYDEPSSRVCRDIDILVKPQDYSEVVISALKCGFGLGTTSGDVVDGNDGQTVEALLRFNSVVSLYSQNGAVIDLHRQIDYDLGVFATDFVLAQAKKVSFLGSRINVLCDEVLLCFLAYHGSRHVWSKMHWVYDFNAVLTPFEGDIDACRKCAKEIGVLNALDNVLLFNQEMNCDVFNKGVSQFSFRVSQILNDCFVSMDGDLEVELQMRRNFNFFQLPYSWLIDRKVWSRAFVRRVIVRLSPTFEQYQVLPLPRLLHWMYVPAKPLFAVLKRCRGK